MGRRKYEYVYGSFSECYEMLVRGEIDLFGNVPYTPERVELVEFSAYPQGKDTYRMYTSKKRTDLATGDIQKINGCRIGVTEGSYEAGLLAGWPLTQRKRSGWRLTIVPFVWVILLTICRLPARKRAN